MTSKSFAFDLATCARPNVLKLEPYRCARDDYKDDGTNILLDANENAYGPGIAATIREKLNDDNGRSGVSDIDFLGLHRYPDPHQIELKEIFCKLRNTKAHTDKDLRAENLFVGVGSDEAIDILLRCFCTPGRDKILTCPPTYGMYTVSAEVNNVEVVKVPLDVEKNFALRPDAINEALSADPTIKVAYICSPGNPTGKLIAKSDIQAILEHPTWNGVVVVDEAYIDFAPEGSSLAEWVLEWPNLVVMQTLSKAFGMAGIRLGVAYTSAPIARLLNSMKAPYNISSPTSALAKMVLSDENMQRVRANIAQLNAQRTRIVNELPKVKGVGSFIGGADANFVVARILDRDGKPSNPAAQTTYERLAEKKGIVVRYRGKEYGCEGGLRVTVGTEQEVTKFLEDIRTVLVEVHASL